MDIPQKNWITTAHALGGWPHSCKYRIHGAGKEVYHSLIIGCINAAKIAVALWLRQLVIPGVASWHFVLCLSPRRLESRTRYNSWFPQWWGRGDSTAWCFLFIPLHWEEEKGGWFKRLGLCPEEALQELPSFALHKTSPRKGSTHPWGKAVAGRGVATPCQPSALVAPTMLCLSQTPAAVGGGSRWWTKWHQSRLPLQLFFSRAVLMTQDMKSFKMAARFLSALFFFWWCYSKSQGAREVCRWKTCPLKPPLNGYGSPAHVRAFQSRLEGELTRGTQECLVWYEKPPGWQWKSN